MDTPSVESPPRIPEGSWKIVGVKCPF